MRLSVKMHRLRAVTAVLLCLSFLCLGACSTQTAGEPGCLFLDGDNVAVDWVLKVNGRAISADEYRYQFLTMRDENDEGDANFWTEETAAILKDQVTEFLSLLVAVEDLAASYGIVRDSASAEYAAQQLTATKAGFESDEAFVTALQELHMNEISYKNQLECDYLQSQLIDVLFGENGAYAVSDTEFLEIVNQDYARVRYLAIKYDAENYAQKREHAENLAQMMNDDTFVEIVNQYNEENAMITNPDGLYLRKGMTHDAAFESACFALEQDEISALVETEYAFYVIKRLAPEEDYVKQNYDDMLNDYYGSIFSELLLQTAENYTVEYAEIFDEISVFNMG